MLFSTLRHVGDLGVQNLEPLKLLPRLRSASLQGSRKAQASAVISNLFLRLCRTSSKVNCSHFEVHFWLRGIEQNIDVSPFKPPQEARDSQCSGTRIIAATLSGTVHHNPPGLPHSKQTTLARQFHRRNKHLSTTRRNQDINSEVTG